MSYSSPFSMPLLEDNNFISFTDSRLLYANPISFLNDPDTVLTPHETRILQSIVATESASRSSTFLPETFTQDIDWNPRILHTDTADTSSLSSSSSTFTPDALSDLDIPLTYGPASQYTSYPWFPCEVPQDYQPIPHASPLGGRESSSFTPHFAEVSIPQAEDVAFPTDDSSSVSRYLQLVVQPGRSFHTPPAPIIIPTIDLTVQAEKPQERKIARRRKFSSTAKPEYICTLCDQAMNDQRKIIKRHNKSMKHNRLLFKAIARLRAQEYGENAWDLYDALLSQFEANEGLACPICPSKFYANRTDAFDRHMKTRHR